MATDDRYGGTMDSQRNSAARSALVFRDSRENDRHRVQLSGLMTVASGDSYGVVVTDISAGGCHVLAPTVVPVGAFLTIEVPGLGSVRGWIAWRRPEELGIVFDGAIPQQVIDFAATLS